MKPHCIIAVCCIVVLAAWFGINHQGNQSPVQAQMQQPQVKTVSKARDIQPEKPTSKELEEAILAVMDAQMSHNSSERHDLGMASELPEPVFRETISSAWEFVDFDPSTGKLTLDERVTVKQPITFHPESVEQVTVGTQVQFSLPEGDHFSATVEKVKISNNGNRSWSGHLDGFGKSYPVVFTSGNNSGFATITTPNGSYSIESINGSGWIYKNPMVRHLTKPGVNDFLLIDDYRHFRKTDRSDNNTEEYIEEKRHNTEQEPVENS